MSLRTKLVRIAKSGGGWGWGSGDFLLRVKTLDGKARLTAGAYLCYISGGV